MKRITKERGRVKQLGIKMRDFDDIVRVADLQEDDRQQSLRSRDLVFEALLPGVQQSFFDHPEMGQDEQAHAQH